MFGGSSAPRTLTLYLPPDSYCGLNVTGLPSYQYSPRVELSKKTRKERLSPRLGSWCATSRPSLSHAVMFVTTLTSTKPTRPREIRRGGTILDGLHSPEAMPHIDVLAESAACKVITTRTSYVLLISLSTVRLSLASTLGVVSGQPFASAVTFSTRYVPAEPRGSSPLTEPSATSPLTCPTSQLGSGSGSVNVILHSASRLCVPLVTICKTSVFVGSSPASSL
mmetsp:Transcript_44862/g.97609  ORF Transcript_44862/g.97609 Transcript_44862/m.97609 type:complete len:223 (+) Transcript_44862:254-922(+)